jgi:hypothetical protein
MYSAQITRANPTCIILLIDQSASMSDPFSGDSAKKKADFVAEVVNHTLHDLVIRCTKTEEVRNYYHISVLGYGREVWSGFSGLLAARDIVPISEVADYPLQIKNSYKRVSDGAGGWVEIPVRYPVWIHPTSEGKTPMCEALSRVKHILERWLSEHPRGFPPTVLHLTDGESSDGEPNDIGRQIMSLGTDDGRVLLFNCHISSRRAPKVEYPTCCRMDSHAPFFRCPASCRVTFSRRRHNLVCKPCLARADLSSTAIHLPSYSSMRSEPV